MRPRLPASASDASRAALNSSKQCEAPPLLPNLLNLREHLKVALTTSSKRSTDYFGTVRARLGYTPIDRLLVYATGGLAFGEAKSSFTVAAPITTPPLNVTSSGKSNVGWTIGGDLEYAFTDHRTAKVEYLYYDLGSKSSTLSYQGFPIRGKAKNDGSVCPCRRQLQVLST